MEQITRYLYAILAHCLESKTHLIQLTLSTLSTHPTHPTLYLRKRPPIHTQPPHTAASVILTRAQPCDSIAVFQSFGGMRIFCRGVSHSYTALNRRRKHKHGNIPVECYGWAAEHAARPHPQRHRSFDWRRPHL